MSDLLKGAIRSYFQENGRPADAAVRSNTFHDCCVYLSSDARFVDT